MRKRDKQRETTEREREEKTGKERRSTKAKSVDWKCHTETGDARGIISVVVLLQNALIPARSVVGGWWDPGEIVTCRVLSTEQRAGGGAGSGPKHAVQVERGWVGDSGEAGVARG